MGRIGYLKEVPTGGRIGRLYPADEVKRADHKVEIKAKKPTGQR